MASWMLLTRWRKKAVGKEEEAAVSSRAEENKAIVRRFEEALTKGDPDAIRELLAPDFVDHRPLQGDEDPGPEGYIRFVANAHAALTDLRYVIEEQMAAEGDRVISRLKIRGTRWYRAWAFGLPITGVAVHMFYRHKTDAWTKRWGGFKDVQSS